MFGRSTFHPDEDIPNLSGRVVVVTGGNSGLGLETVRQLARHNPAHIYLAGRSREKCEAAIKHVEESERNVAPITFLRLDLSSFESVKAAANTFKSSESRLDILVNNAGIMMTPENLTKEGYEIQFGTNHMGHALFTQLLLPTLRDTAKINPKTRVVNVSSATEALAPKDLYNFTELKSTMPDRHTTTRYAISKLANIHYNSELARQYKDVKLICVHPGAVATNLHTNASGFFLKMFLNLAAPFTTQVEKGALNQIWASASPDAQTGMCYAPVGLPWKSSKASQDRQLQEQLWRWTQDELKQHL